MRSTGSLPEPNWTAERFCARPMAASWRKVGSIPGVLITALSFADRENGWASVEERQGDHHRRMLMRTTDGGVTWTLVRETPTDHKEIFMYLCFVDRMHGFAGSD